MSTEEFYTNWNKCFPNSYPIDYELKYTLKSRWLRIHSLPESKQYAETKEDEQIILERYNTVISDVLSAGSKVILLVGLFSLELDDNDFSSFINTSEFKFIDKIKLSDLNLESHKNEETFENEFYNIFIKEEVWVNNGFNEFLLSLAKGERRMAIVDFNKCLIVHPYEGGIDLIYPTTEIKEAYKMKYSEWLSKREDGF